jgi:K319L-like, PKD domain
MRKIALSFVLGAALLLSACGTPTSVNDAANQAATAISNPTASSALNEAATAVTNPTNVAAVNDALNHAGTAVSDPTNAAMLNEAATAAAGPEVATAVSDAAGTLSAAAEDVTLEQGEALVLDATKSAGDIKDYKWTITKAPTGAESVVGQVIKEASSGNVTIEPADYTKYFPKSGDYTVQLTVTDTAGKTASNDIDITVP